MVYCDWPVRLIAALLALSCHFCLQDIRNFVQLSYSDVVSVAPPAANMQTYNDSVANSYCSTYS